VQNRDSYAEVICHAEKLLIFICAAGNAAVQNRDSYKEVICHAEKLLIFCCRQCCSAK
jgi:hypothetical protein